MSNNRLVEGLNQTSYTPTQTLIFTLTLTLIYTLTLTLTLTNFLLSFIGLVEGLSQAASDCHLPHVLVR